MISDTFFIGLQPRSRDTKEKMEDKSNAFSGLVCFVVFLKEEV